MKEFYVWFTNGESILIRASYVSNEYPIIRFVRNFTNNPNMIVATFNFDNIAGWEERT